MENYCKGKNVEEPLERTKIPIANLPEDFLWMQVKGSSKIRNFLSFALTEFPEIKSVLWTGSGTSVGKAITCAELMKRECNNSLHQITKLCYRLVEEYWNPLNPELDQIVVKRKLPVVHIYLSKDPLNTDELGYQAPGIFIPYRPHENESSNRRQIRNKKNKNTRWSAEAKRKGKLNKTGNSGNSSSSNCKNTSSNT